MAACPWCKAKVSDPLAPCPRCGRRSDDQAEMLPGVVDVPDLVMPARKVSMPRVPIAAPAPSPAAPVPAPPKAAGVPLPPPAAPAAAPPPARPRAPLSAARLQAGREEKANNAFNDPGARTFDADDDLSDGPLDLDLKGPPLIDTLSKGATAAAGPDEAKGAPPIKIVAKDGAPAIEVDPFEARALADYGDPPAQWWKAPLYAYRVLRRRPELKKLAAQKTREAERARGAADDALMAFGEVVRSTAEKLGAYEGAFDAVRATETVLGQRDAVLAQETDAHRHRQAQFDAQLAEQEAQLMQIQVEERQVAGELAEGETLLKRAEARAKRVEIEMRTAIAQAQAGASPDVAKEPLP